VAPMFCGAAKAALASIIAAPATQALDAAALAIAKSFCRPTAFS